MAQLIRGDRRSIFLSDSFNEIADGADFKWLSIVITEDRIGIAVFQCFREVGL